jgi:hypothetical protein
MKTLLLVLSLTSSFAIAETATMTVEGMHCSGCKKIITKKVCENEAVAKSAETCEVKLVNEEKQIGEITITTKKDVKLDVENVRAQLKAAGDDYKLAKVEIKEITKKDLQTAASGQPENPAKATEVVTTETTIVQTTNADQHKNHADTKTTKKVKKTKKVAKKAEAAAPAATTTTTTETKKETK